MPDPDSDRILDSDQRAVTEAAERVLEDRFTDLDDPGGGGSGASTQTASLYPVRMDPGFTPAPAGHPLRRALTKVAAQQSFRHLRLAVADLTGDPLRPVYAGHQDDVQTFVASVAKLALVVPAFQLREAAAAAAAELLPKDLDELFSQLRKRWSREFRRFALKGANNKNPDLPRILAARFGAKGPPAIAFSAQEPPEMLKRGFGARLALALDQSDDAAASSCIQQLGFPFIRGANETAGLTSFARSKGLWLNLDYAGHAWDPRHTGTGQGATARSVATLLALIAQDRLIRPGLRNDIMAILSDGSPGHGRSDIFKGIRDRLSEVEKSLFFIRGKVGFTDRTAHDCGIVERTTEAGTALTYVAVILGGGGGAEVQAAGAALDDCVLLAHGEKPKP